MKKLQDFPRVSLGLFPTPIQKLENVSRRFGANVYLKRDDLTGLGLGGNKVRKLEFLLADAKAQGAEVVFTTGGAQSNHAMLTAAAANRLGMKPILILKKRGVTARRGNQLLEHLMGTDVRFVDTDSYDDIYAEMDRVGEALGVPYYKIPCGGSARSATSPARRRSRDRACALTISSAPKGAAARWPGLRWAQSCFCPARRCTG